MQPSWRKAFQKQAYDIISHRYGLLTVVVGVILITVSAFHFGETVIDWSKEKYAAVFNSFSDNIARRSFRERLCLPVPIDVVYTWVNGTDSGIISQLRHVRLEMEKELNMSRSISVDKDGNPVCVFANCLPTNMIVLDPLIPEEITLDDLVKISPVYRFGKQIFTVASPSDASLNFTVVPFDNDTQVIAALKEKLVVNGVNIMTKRAYITTDWMIQHSILLHDTIIMSGFPRRNITTDELKEKFPEKHRKAIAKIEIHEKKGVAVLYIPDKKEFEDILQESNFTIDGKEPTLNSANLIWDLRDLSRDEDVSASRFQDNEELRYSLRSVEKFAPWVRNIYIVTNGQIPYWLNIENPRVKIITHDEIFANKSHLPTFASPAIEANLHKIPGLSDKFIYMNDDVMFGTEIWPDDFFSYSSGQKVYLTWPVPNCNEGCPGTWIKDGYCDKACNNSECEWDGGDCLGNNVQPGVGAFPGFDTWGGDYNKMYCNTGCTNSWLADRYCDNLCNVRECGFDAGDCGTNAYTGIDGIMLESNKTEYIVPPGETVVYFNLTMLIRRGSIVEASFNNSEVIRVAAVALKFKVLTLVLYPNFNRTQLYFVLIGYRINKNDTFQYNFTVEVDTKTKMENKTIEVKVVDEKMAANKSETSGENVTEHFIFSDIIEHKRAPHVKKIVFNKTGSDIGTHLAPKNWSSIPLPSLFEKQADFLHKQLINDEITNKGFDLKSAQLWQKILTFLELESDTKESHVIEILKKWHPQAVMDSILKPQKRNKRLNDVANGSSIPPKGSNSFHPKVKSDLQNSDRGTAKKLQLSGNIPNIYRVKVEKDEIFAQKDTFQHALPVINMAPDQQAGYQQNIVGENKVDNVPVGNLAPVQKGGAESEGQVIAHGQQAANIINMMWNVNQSMAVKQFAAGSQGQKPKNLFLKSEQKQGDLLNISKVPVRKLQEFKIEMNEDLSLRKTDQEIIKMDIPISPDFESVVFPWEKSGAFAELQKEKENWLQSAKYQLKRHASRRLLDTFGDSLRHVNKLYSEEFGSQARKVIGHMPHMIDKNIMSELQDRFPKEWDETSSHRVRHANDMQYAFSYFYYLMGVKVEVTPIDIFDTMDTDKSRVLSDRELRTMATRLYELPLDLPTITGLENIFVNCSQHLPPEKQLEYPPTEMESYYEKSMPQVTRNLFIHCAAMIELIKNNFKPTHKYKFSVLDDSDITFKMIKTNVSTVVGQLDDIRRHPKKFICLNDNIDHMADQAKTVKAILQDFYESFFPLQSQFELPMEYRNRFLHMNELKEWRHYRDWLKFWTHLALCVLVVLTVASYFAEKIDAAQRRLLGRRLHYEERMNSCTSDKVEEKSENQRSLNIVETV